MTYVGADKVSDPLSLDLADLRTRLAGVTTPAMGGDNLAIVLASFFEPNTEGDEMDDSGAWKKGAIDAADAVLDAIHEIYAAPFVFALRGAASLNEHAVRLRNQLSDCLAKNRIFAAASGHPDLVETMCAQDILTASARAATLEQENSDLRINQELLPLRVQRLEKQIIEQEDCIRQLQRQNKTLEKTLARLRKAVAPFTTRRFIKNVERVCSELSAGSASLCDTAVRGRS